MEPIYPHVIQKGRARTVSDFTKRQSAKLDGELDKIHREQQSRIRKLDSQSARLRNDSWNEMPEDMVVEDETVSHVRNATIKRTRSARSTKHVTFDKNKNKQGLSSTRSSLVRQSSLESNDMKAKLDVDVETESRDRTTSLLEQIESQTRRMSVSEQHESHILSGISHATTEYNSESAHTPLDHAPSLTKKKQSAVKRSKSMGVTEAYSTEIRSRFREGHMSLNPRVGSSQVIPSHMTSLSTRMIKKDLQKLKPRSRLELKNIVTGVSDLSRTRLQPRSSTNPEQVVNTAIKTDYETLKECRYIRTRAKTPQEIDLKDIFGRK